jgi:hypothetical protein
MSDFVDPPYSAWAELLQRNIASRSRLSAVLGDARVAAIRAEVMEHARMYSRYLKDIAVEREVILGNTQPLAEDAQNGIVMAGHQPVVFHPGLLFKTELLSRFAKDTRAFGIHVVIDTDEGDLCEVSWPRIDGERLIVRRAAIADAALAGERNPASPILYSSQRVKSREEIRLIFDEMQSDLCVSGFLQEAARAQEIGAVYERLAECPLAVANSIARWSTEHRGYREVQLSTLLKQTSLREVLSELTQDS